MNIHSAKDIIRYGIVFINEHKYLLLISIAITLLPLVPIIPLLPALIFATTNHLDPYIVVPGLIGITITIMIIWVSLLGLFYPIISELVYHSLQNQKISFKEAFKKAIAKWLPLLGLYLVIFITNTVINMLLGTSLVASALRALFLYPVFSLAMPIILFSTETTFSSLKLACTMGWRKLRTVVMVYLLEILILCSGLMASMLFVILLFMAFLQLTSSRIILATTLTSASLVTIIMIIICTILVAGPLLAYTIWYQILFMTIPTIFYASYDQLETR